MIYEDADGVRAALAEFRRVLGAGGALLIAVHAGDGVRHFSDYKGIAVDITLHLRDPDAFAALVRSAGFTLQSLRGPAALPLRARDGSALRRRARRLSERSRPQPRAVASR